jgi:glycosyltransferase involved in cell wall biosynthesis
MNYNLCYILLWQDVNLPLVLSQTFDQAQKQTEVYGEHRPKSISVWIMTPLRFCLGKNERMKIATLRMRCPGVTISLIPEVNRLHDFPSSLFLNFYRNKLHEARIVFHFRGEATLLHFTRQYKKRSNDVYLLDVRGYWPAEWLYERGIEDINHIPDQYQTVFEQTNNHLKNALQLASGIITVSENLAKLLRELVPSIPAINVVPCAVGSLRDRSKRDRIRESLGVKPNEKLLVYSGGYARYQHLEDLTIPFFDLLLNLSAHTRVLILSQDMDSIRNIIREKANNHDRFIYRKVPQSEVGDYLTACDLGFLLRKESLVNTVAQPVKVGEYLAAGVPVCVQGEVGGVTEQLIRYQAGITVHVAGKNEEEWHDQANLVLEFLKVDHSKNAQSLANDFFIWEKNVIRQREYYYRIFES